VGQRTKKDTEIKLYETVALSCIKYWYSSETWTDGRAGEGQVKASGFLFLSYSAGHTLCDKKGSEGTRSHLGVRKLGKQMHKRKKNLLQNLKRMHEN
jgi:hypothetical protein